jgi:hypothetical protein
MRQDSPEVRGNKTIRIILEMSDGGLEIIHPIDQINTSVGVFQDYLEKMIGNANYKNIKCELN